jgi:hypothetical protein
MKALLTAFLLSLVSTSVVAATSLGAVTGSHECFNFEELRTELREKHEEKPFVFGDGSTTLFNLETEKLELAKHTFYLFANPKTYNYTLVLKMDDVGCVLSVGKNFGPVVQDGI